MKKKDEKVVKDQAVQNRAAFEFSKINYILLVSGLVLIFAGYLFMVGGGSEDPSLFSDKIFDFRRLTLSPILILLGFAVEVVAILYHPKK